MRTSVTTWLWIGMYVARAAASIRSGYEPGNLDTSIASLELANANVRKSDALCDVSVDGTKMLGERKRG